MAILLIGHGNLNTPSTKQGKLLQVGIPNNTKIRYYGDVGQSLLYSPRSLIQWYMNGLPGEVSAVSGPTGVTYNYTLTQDVEFFKTMMPKFREVIKLRAADDILLSPGFDGEDAELALCTGTSKTCPEVGRKPQQKVEHSCNGILGRFPGKELLWLGCQAVDTAKWRDEAGLNEVLGALRSPGSVSERNFPSKTRIDLRKENELGDSLLDELDVMRSYATSKVDLETLEDLFPNATPHELRGYLDDKTITDVGKLFERYLPRLKVRFFSAWIDRIVALESSGDLDQLEKTMIDALDRAIDNDHFNKHYFAAVQPATRAYLKRKSPRIRAIFSAEENDPPSEEDLKKAARAAKQNSDAFKQMRIRVEERESPIIQSALRILGKATGIDALEDGQDFAKLYIQLDQEARLKIDSIPEARSRMIDFGEAAARRILGDSDAWEKAEEDGLPDLLYAPSRRAMSKVFDGVRRVLYQQAGELLSKGAYGFYEWSGELDRPSFRGVMRYVGSDRVQAEWRKAAGDLLEFYRKKYYSNPTPQLRGQYVEAVKDRIKVYYFLMAPLEEIGEDNWFPEIASQAAPKQDATDDVGLVTSFIQLAQMQGQEMAYAVLIKMPEADQSKMLGYPEAARAIGGILVDQFMLTADKFGPVQAVNYYQTLPAGWKAVIQESEKGTFVLLCGDAVERSLACLYVHSKEYFRHEYLPTFRDDIQSFLKSHPTIQQAYDNAPD